MGNVNIKINNEWKRSELIYAKKGNTWIPVSGAYVKHNNVWKDLFYGEVLNFGFSFNNETLDAQSSSLLGVWDLAEMDTDSTSDFWRNKANGFAPTPDYQRMRIGLNLGGPLALSSDDSPTKDSSAEVDANEIATVVLNATAQLTSQPLDSTPWGSKKLGAISFWVHLSDDVNFGQGSSREKSISLRTDYAGGSDISAFEFGSNSSGTTYPVTVRRWSDAGGADWYGGDNGLFNMTKGWHKICIMYRPTNLTTNTESDPAYRLYVDGTYIAPSIRRSHAVTRYFDLKNFEIAFGIYDPNTGKSVKLSQVCLWEQLSTDDIADHDAFAAADYNNGIGNRYAIHHYEKTFGRTEVDRESSNLLAVYDLKEKKNDGSLDYWVNQVHGETENDNLYVRTGTTGLNDSTVETPWGSSNASVNAGSTTRLQVGGEQILDGQVPSSWKTEEIGAMSVWVNYPSTGGFEKAANSLAAIFNWNNVSGQAKYGRVEFGHNSSSSIVEGARQVIGDHNSNTAGFGSALRHTLNGWCHLFIARRNDSVAGTYTFKVYINGAELVPGTVDDNNYEVAMLNIDTVQLLIGYSDSSNIPFNAAQFCLWKKLSNDSDEQLKEFATAMYNHGNGLNFQTIGNQYEGVNPRNVDEVSAYYSISDQYIDHDGTVLSSWFDSKETETNTLYPDALPSTVGIPSFDGSLVKFSNNVLSPESSLSVREAWLVINEATGVYRQLGGPGTDITPLFGQNVGASSTAHFTFLSNSAGYTVSVAGNNVSQNGIASVDQSEYSSSGGAVTVPGYTNYPTDIQDRVMRIQFNNSVAPTDLIGGLNSSNSAHAAHDLQIKDIVFADQIVSQEISDGIVEYLMKKHDIPYVESEKGDPLNVPEVSAYFTADDAYITKTGNDVDIWHDRKNSNDLVPTTSFNAVGVPTHDVDKVILSKNALEFASDLTAREVIIVVSKANGTWVEGSSYVGTDTPLYGRNVNGSTNHDYTFLKHTTAYTISVDGPGTSIGSASIDNNEFVYGANPTIPGYESGYPSTEETHVIRVKYEANTLINAVGLFRNHINIANDLHIKAFVIIDSEINDDVSQAMVDYLKNIYL